MRGIIPSLHTPFSKDNKIDLNSLKKLIDHTISSGCAGMLVGAVAGENSSLSFNEKTLMINESVNLNQNRIPTIVSCSAKEQKDRVALSILAKEAGAEWILCQAPDSMFGKQLLECFQEIADVGPKYLMIQDLSWSDNGMKDEDILMLHNKIQKFRRFSLLYPKNRKGVSLIVIVPGMEMILCTGKHNLGLHTCRNSQNIMFNLVNIDININAVLKK